MTPSEVAGNVVKCMVPWPGNGTEPAVALAVEVSVNSGSDITPNGVMFKYRDAGVWHVCDCLSCSQPLKVDADEPSDNTSDIDGGTNPTAIGAAIRTALAGILLLSSLVFLAKTKRLGRLITCKKSRF